MSYLIKIGDQEKVITSIKMSDDGFTKTLSMTYEDDFDAALENAPAIGSSTAFSQGMSLIKVDVDSDAGSIGIVNLTYEAKPEEPPPPPDPEEPPPDPEDPDGPGGGGGSGSEKQISYQLSVSTTEEHILTNEAFKGLSEDKLILLKYLMDGTRLFDMVNKVDENGAYIDTKKKDEAGNIIYEKETLKQALEGSGIDAKIVGKIKKGITSYRSPGAIWSKKYVSNGPPLLSGVGKISAPAGPAPSAGSRNWLLSCREASSFITKENNIRWEVTETWELSGPTGWDKELYS